MHRCYCPDLPDTGIIALPPEEAHHAGSVLRLQVGDSLVLFDGAGREAQARVYSASKKTIEVEIESVAEVNRESKRRLTIAIALPKGDRQKWLIEKCVELGVAQILPLDVERSVAKAEKQVVQRLERQVIEASKQCRRNTLMKILDPMKWSEFLNQADKLRVASCELREKLVNGAISQQQLIKEPSQAENVRKDCLKLIAHPGGISVQDALTKVGENGDVLVAIGPEGGFTDEECASAVDSGFEHLSLGSRILRIETAAISLAAQICN
ncbi:MAG: 16S rRNA (uracil(1498)-N(3))-methyltransferase [Thermoguttaceae bacterium]|nr:16S rRNA (uracil(1498)-N(3))-methyltransferase [Thermoguttaceae bacterium]